VDSKAECDQLNLAHETKTKNASAHLFQYRLKIRDGSPEGIRRLYGGNKAIVQKKRN